MDIYVRKPPRTPEGSLQVYVVLSLEPISLHELNLKGQKIREKGITIPSQPCNRFAGQPPGGATAAREPRGGGGRGGTVFVI